MGSLGRKMRRKRDKAAKKTADKMMKQVTEKVSSMPNTCVGCDAQFDNTDKESLDQWHVAVYHDNRIELTCPNCVQVPDNSEISGAV